MNQYQSPEAALQAFQEAERRVQLAAKLVGIPLDEFDLLGNSVLIKVHKADFSGPEYDNVLIPQEFNSSLQNFGEVVKLGVDSNSKPMVIGFEVGDKIVFDPKVSTNRTGLFFNEEDPESYYFQVSATQILGKLTK